MRVVFVGHSAGMLGAERSMFDIVSGAVGDGHDVAVVLPTTGPLVAALRGVGATVHIHPMRAWMGARHWIPPVGDVRDSPLERRKVSSRSCAGSSLTWSSPTRPSSLPEPSRQGVWLSLTSGLFVSPCGTILSCVPSCRSVG